MVSDQHTVELIGQMVLNEHRLIMEDLSETVDINSDMVHSILTEIEDEKGLYAVSH